MKIGIDIRTLTGEHFSGVPEYTFNLVKEILRLDSSNRYKLFYNSAASGRCRKLGGPGRNYEIVHTRYPNKVFNFAMQGIAGYPKIDQLLGVDLFFMPNIGFISLSDSCKKILTVHDLSFLRYQHFFSLKRRLWHRTLNIKKLIRSFDLIVAVSENTKHDIVELANAPENKIKVIPSGLSREFYPISDNKKLSDARKKYKLPDNFIFTLSTLEPRKNICGLIKAFDIALEEKLLPKDYFLVIGGAAGWKSRSIMRSWKKSKNNAKIKFLGYIDSRDKPALYNLAELFVYPSFYEGFGFPPLEAAACATPVICSAAGSLPEVIGDFCLMADPWDCREIARAMAESLADRSGFGKIKYLRAQEIINRYDWEKSALEYIRLFHQ